MDEVAAAAHFFQRIVILTREEGDTVVHTKGHLFLQVIIPV
jgi:hypothetical protein